MDWSRAKNILIAVLILLNIYMGANVILMFTGSGVAHSVINDARKALTAKGIEFSPECRIPSAADQVSSLIFENEYDFDRDRMERILTGGADGSVSRSGRKLTFGGTGAFIFEDPGCSGTIDMSDRRSTEKTVRSYLSSLGLPVGRFILDHYDAGAGRLLFTEKYRGLLVFDNYFEVFIKNGGISGINCSIRRIRMFSGKGRRVMPIHQVLLLWDREIQEEEGAESIVIKRIDLGFRSVGSVGPGSGTKEFSESPVWRIMLGDGSYRYFKAYDAEEI